MKIGKMLAILLATSAMSAAHGQGYLGANYFAGEFDGGSGFDFDVDAVYARGGINLSDWAAIEARAGFGLSEESIVPLVDAKLDTLYGAYFVAGIPNDSVFFPYAMLGYTRGEVTIDFPGGSESESEGDVSLGLGTDIHFNDFFGLNLEYTQYLDKNGVDISGFTAGVKFSF